jgi:nucleotide-binding universal stress UspA family protein
VCIFDVMNRLASKVVVSTDFSDVSHIALDTGVLVARQNDAELELIYVATPTSGDVGDDASVHAQLDALLAGRAAGLRASARVVHARSAAEGICQHAAAVGADLIAIATHGRTGRAHALIGSVAEQVVRMAPCPVLAVRQ